MGEQDQHPTHHIGIDTLNAYLDDVVTPEERRAIEAHLASCAACRNDLAELRTLVGLLHELPQFDPPVSFQLGPEHARPQASEPGKLIRLLPIVRTLAVAAMLAFMIASGWLVADRIGQDNGNQTTDQSAPMALAPTAAPTSVVAENGNVGGTGNEAQTSNATEDEQAAPERRSALPSSAERSSAPLIDRGDSASTNGAAPDESGSSTPQTLSEQEPPLAAETVDTSTNERGNQWLLTVIGLGVLAVILVGLWILLIRLSRQRRIG